MKPVTQAQLHDPDSGVYGTCMAACIASLLEVEESAVPLRYLDKALNADGGWWEPLVEDLEREFGVGIVYIPWPHLVEPRGWCIINGKSPRGDYGHSVVGYRGQVVWDPHPSRAGLVDIEDYYILDPVPEHAAMKAAA